MRVLYIGGTGEISYECIRAGVEAGQDVTVFNRGLNDEPLPKGVRRIVGSLDDRAAYAKLGDERFDTVCQFLAYDMKTIEQDLATFGGKVGQYLFISSASAYQKPPQGYVVTEDIPLINPFWGYSRSKAAMEQRLMEWHAAGKLPVTIVRPSHTYRKNWPGTFFGNEELGWRILNGRTVICHGDGTSLWVLTHSRDFARPFVRLLGNPRALGEAFHITTDEANSWGTIFQAVGAALGVEPRIVHVPSDTLVRLNPDWTGPLWGDKSWTLLFDNSKVKSVAGDFTCKIKMAEGMKMVAEHFLKRVAGFQPDQKRQAQLDRIAESQQALQA